MTRDSRQEIKRRLRRNPQTECCRALPNCALKRRAERTCRKPLRILTQKQMTHGSVSNRRNLRDFSSSNRQFFQKSVQDLVQTVNHQLTHLFQVFLIPHRVTDAADDISAVNHLRIAGGIGCQKLPFRKIPAESHHCRRSDIKGDAVSASRSVAGL